MNVIIFGSTGRTGKYLIQFALEAGLHVTAFARNPDLVSVHHARLALFQGDATNAEAVKLALAGMDAVLFAVGTDLGETNLRQTAMKNIVAGMHKNQVRRIIGIGGMGILQANETTRIFETEGFPKEYIPVSQDHEAAFEFLQLSGLDFTFVCPPTIPDGPVTGHYITRETYSPEGNLVITTGDLADFMVKELLEPRYIGKKVGIATL